MIDKIVSVTMVGFVVIYIVLIAILIWGIIDAWADSRKGERIKKKMDENNAKEFLEFLEDDDTYKTLRASLHFKMIDSLTDFHERCEKEGRVPTGYEEVAFTDGMENGINITMNLIVEILRKLVDDSVCKGDEMK